MLEALQSNEFVEYLQSHGLMRWLLPVAVTLLTWVVMAGLVRFLWNRLLKWSRTFSSRAMEMVISQSRYAVQLSVFVVACGTGLLFAPESVTNRPFARSAPSVLLILLGTWITAGAATVTLQHLRFHDLGDRGRRWLVNFTRLVIIGFGVLIVLDTLGVSIRPLLASLGIGSIAIALALQDTLGNLFSGLYILIDRPVREGDYIRIDSTTVEGTVKQIGWRSTRILSLSNNMILIPNSKLSSSIVTNFDLPDSPLSVPVMIGVAYGSDLRRVERVTLEVAVKIQQTVTEALTGHAPTLRFQTFGEFAVQFTVFLRANRFEDTFIVRHEFMKAIYERYLVEKIEIPLPQRVVRMESPTGE